MSNPIFKLILITLSFSILSAAHGLPIQLDRFSFNSRSLDSSLFIQTETFEDIPLDGSSRSPFTFANGTLNSNATIENTDFGLCFTSQCLFDLSQSREVVKTFDNLPVDTSYWGGDVYVLRLGAIINPFAVTVVGGSGTAVFSNLNLNNSFLGFFDALGILSVSFTDLGGGPNPPASDLFADYNTFTFDNITTASLVAVPEPTGLALFAITITGMFFRGVGSNQRT
ncbi:MAG: hypothetical protein GKR94_07600 [Gammaproteobacteria bacterium]|nr:hypothetical protein [Gammaproteobacteria bacterium]